MMILIYILAGVGAVLLIIIGLLMWLSWGLGKEILWMHEAGEE